MELNQEWVSKAQDAFDHSPSNREGIAAAIETYLAEMFKPGPLMTLEPLEAIPQRDYRKEAWIAALTTGNGAPWADQVLAHFDKTFPREKPHG